jgi:hypothetical protein
MARRLHINGSTRIERDDMTARVAEAISLSGAWLVGFSMFSNVSATMRVGLPARHLDVFGRRLRATGLVLDEDSSGTISTWANGSEDEVVATLQIAFLTEETDAETAAAAAPA